MATKIVKPPPTRRTPNGRSQGRIAAMSSSWQFQRSETPKGFAAAFYEANKLAHNDATVEPRWQLVGASD